MPRGLRRFHESGQSHFITFSCYRRQPNFANAAVYDLFPRCLEDMRRRFDMRVYGYVVMPEHVHLLLSEPDHGTLAEAIHYLKLSFAKRLRSLVPQLRQRVGAPGSRVGAPGSGLGIPDSRLGAPGSPLFWANLGSDKPNPFWQKRYYDRNVRDAREFSVKLRDASQSGETRTGEGTRRLEVEQFPALCFRSEEHTS